MNPSTVKRFAIGWIGVWGSLGMFRGVQEYNYNHFLHRKENPSYEQKKYFYSKSIGNAFLGALFYVTPFTWPYCLTREIYRLEINLYGLKKDIDYYALV